MVLDIRPFKRTNNVNILNAIRNHATLDYRNRIPLATQANIQDNLARLTEFRPLMNEFVDALVNRIGLEIIRGSLWTNPLSHFKYGMLQFGDTIEEINVGLIKAIRFDPDKDYLEQDIFGRETPDVQSSFHKVNRMDVYKLTVDETLLKRAFNSEYGLSDFVTKLMATPQTSDEWDEFLLTTSLFGEYYRNGGFFKVQVPDVSSADSDEADAKYMLRRLREFTGNLGFMSTYYNASGMPVAAPVEDLELFVTPEALGAIDVEALAGAFNEDKAKFMGRVTIVPKEYFRIPGVQAVLTTKDFFIIADELIETTSVQNPMGLHTNYFLHHRQVISASRFVPAILFTTEEGDVIDPEVIEPESVDVPTLTDVNGDAVTVLTRGAMHTVTADVDPDGANDAVRFELVGAQSLRTYLSQTGTLHVAPEEDATELTVNVYAVDDFGTPQLSNTYTFDVVGAKVEYWPNRGVFEDADNDGVLEPELPDPLTISDAWNVRIPSTEGLQWRKTIATGVTFTDSGDVVTVPNHKANVDDKIVFGTITSTTGVSAGTTYYIKEILTDNTFTISATKGGSVLALTTNGSAASATIDVENGSLQNVPASSTRVFSAVAASAAYEIPGGVTSSWSFTRP